MSNHPLLPSRRLRWPISAVVLVVVIWLGALARLGVLASPPALASTVTSSATPTSTAGSTPPAAAGRVPALSYFYIWFDPTSWNRAKSDIPLAGRYSSDDRSVMQEQVRMAKAAGFDGFIVSWKSTPTLNRRLSMLADIAEAQHFKLVVIYEGLDFSRKPTPTADVAADLDYFIRNFAVRPAFQLFAKPAVILSGSWDYSTADIASLAAGRRGQILLLASEKNTSGIVRLRGLVDGDAYYWSSVNPDTNPDYQGKLDQMAAATHAGGGLWIAPAAAGFDARLVGGTSTVDRRGGQTLRTEFTAASRSGPDAIGVISWNEFSENSAIEPSRQYGVQSLQTIAPLLGGVAPTLQTGGLDSSEPGSRGSGWDQTAAVGVLVILTVGAAVVLARRHRRSESNPDVTVAVPDDNPRDWAHGDPPEWANGDSRDWAHSGEWRPF